MSSARLGSPLTLKLPTLTSMILPSLSFSSTPFALCAEIKTLCPASIHPPVRIIMSTSNAVTSNSTGERSAPLAIRTPFPWIRGGVIMRLLTPNFSPTSNRLGEISFRTCAARACAFIAVGIRDGKRVALDERRRLKTVTFWQSSGGKGVLFFHSCLTREGGAFA
jgi:hypothetical protein